MREMLVSNSGEKKSMLSFSRMVPGEVRGSSKSRSERERPRCWVWEFGSRSLLFVPGTVTGLSPDGKEDGGGRGGWPLRNARVTATAKPSKNR